MPPKDDSWKAGVVWQHDSEAQRHLASQQMSWGPLCARKGHRAGEEMGMCWLQGW